MNVSPIATRIGIVGTGRAAQAFALALCRRAPQGMLICGRDAAKIAHVVAVCDGHARAADLGTIAAQCDVIVIAVADHAIVPVAQSLAGEALLHAPFAFHLSGGSGVAALSSLKDGGAITATVHPAMTFTGHPQLEVARIAGAAFAVTGSDARGTAMAMAIVDTLGGRAVELSEAHRPLYHAALCHASNHLVTLVSGSCEALQRAGIADPAAFLAPLATAALDNALKRGMDGLSGPIVRGDAATVAAHLTALAEAAPAFLPAYSAMAHATVAMLEREGRSISKDIRSLLPV